jgi:hypothetical protein
VEWAAEVVEKREATRQMLMGGACLQIARATASLGKAAGAAVDPTIAGQPKSA